MTVQAHLLDGHIWVEQVARSRWGLPFIAGEATAGRALTVVAIMASVLGFVGTFGFLAASLEPPKRGRHFGEIFAALILTSVLLLSNARGAFEALAGHQSEFVRTPKTIEAHRPPVRNRMPYGLPEFVTGLGLLGFGLVEQPATVPFLAIVIGGLVGLGAMQMLDGRWIHLAHIPR